MDEPEEEDAQGNLCQDGNRIVGLHCLQELLSSVAVCKSCRTGSLQVNESEQVGLGSSVTIYCSNRKCRLQHTALLSMKMQRYYDVNRKAVLAIRRWKRPCCSEQVLWTDATTRGHWILLHHRVCCR